MKQFILTFLSSSILLIIGISCVPLDQSNTPNFVPKKIQYIDQTYNELVGAVLLYNQNQLNPPIAELRSNEKITVEFDLFENTSDYVNAKLIHCDSYWNKSNIPDLQVFDEFNQFLFTDYQFSENTDTDYVHYKMDLPKPKISGNYLLAVYRGNNKEDLLFTRRFMITEKLVTIQSSIQIPRQVEKRNTGQELNLNVIYENITTNNPQQEIFATVRQNFRWDNAKMNVKPTNDIINERKLEFQSFNNELTFSGGNEFRLIDLRSKSIPGMNVANIDKKPNGIFVDSRVFRPYNGVVYTRPINDDLNGNYFQSIIDIGADPLEVDYVYATFNIDLPKKYSEPIYIVGKFNSWDHDEKSQLKFDDSTNLYQTTYHLKQGLYEFTVESAEKENKIYPLDKSFRLTENTYDIIIYQKIIGTTYDRIIGYHSYTSGRN